MKRLKNILNIKIDSRKIKKGDIFIPVKGEKYDGHRFIKEALARGAKQVWDVDLGQVAYKHRSKFNIPIIAVTGSSGKTTIKDLLFSVLSKKYKVLKTDENENNEIGLPLTLLKLNSTIDIAVIEIAMRNRGDIEYLTKIAKPTHVVIANIGLTHIERLGNEFNIAKAKAEVFNHDGKIKQTAYLNSKTKYFKFLRRCAKTKGYAIKTFYGKSAFEENKNLVIKIAKDFKLNKTQIKKGMATYRSSSNRMEFITLKNGMLVINDSYNANPHSMAAAIKYLGKRKGRKIAVLGDMLELGKFSKREHIKLGKLLKNIELDYLLTFGKLSKMIKFNKKKHAKSHKELLSKIIELVRPIDNILVKGSRSMQLDKIVKSIVKKFGKRKKEYFKF